MSVMSPLTDSARSGGGAYSGRMTEQSLTVQRSCRLERGSAPESVAIRDTSHTQITHTYIQTVVSTKHRTHRIIQRGNVLSTLFCDFSVK